MNEIDGVKQGAGFRVKVTVEEDFCSTVVKND